MDRDHFIIYVYCLVCQHYQEIVKHQPLRRRGFPPALSDAEVITIEICGEYFGFDEDEAIYEYFRSHYRNWFPNLKDRTVFVRQAANLWRVKALIQHRLTEVSQQIDDPIQPIDTLPLPVCVYTRSKRDRCFKPDVWLLCGQRPALLWFQAGIAHFKGWNDYPLPALACTPSRYSISG
jgi:hypothetical protein